MSDETIGTDIVTSISRRFLMPEWPGMKRLTPDDVRAHKAQREREWKDNTAGGLVGVNYDHDDHEWSRADRHGYVERWVGADSWKRYVDALGCLKAAEADLA